MTLVAHIWKEKTLYAGRFNEFTWSMYGDNRTTPVGIAANDVIRFKLYDKDTRALLLDIDSIDQDADSRTTVTAIGLSGTTPASGTVRVAQAAIAADTEGVYEGELILVDNSETNPDDAAKVFGRGDIRIEPSAEGDLGIADDP